MCVIPNSANYFCVCLSLATFASLTITATNDEPDSKIYFGHFLIICLRYEHKIIILLSDNIISHAQNNVEGYQIAFSHSKSIFLAILSRWIIV